MSSTEKVPFEKWMFAEATQAITSAEWNIDYVEFLKRIRNRDDDYARSKFISLQRLATSLAEFDVDTLYRICYGE